MEFHAEEVPAAMTEEASEAHTEVEIDSLLGGRSCQIPQICSHDGMPWKNGTFT